MSKIQAELLITTGIKVIAGEARPAFLDRLMMATKDLDDAKWNSLTDPAADWFNAAMDVKNENIKAPASAKPIPDFPDYKAETPKEETSTRRRRSADDEPAAAAVTEREPEVGDICHVISKKGREYTGEVVELTADDIVLKIGADEIEIGLDGAKVTVQGGEQDAGGEPEGPVEPQVGDTVRIVNSRDREYTGEVVELNEEDVTVSINGEPVDFAIAKLKTFEVIGGSAAPAPAPAPAAAGRSRRATTEDVKAPAGAAEGEKPKRSSNPKGVSIGGRVRELMAEDVSVSEADVVKIMKKEGLEFREVSVGMIYKDCKTFLDLLKANKKLK